MNIINSIESNNLLKIVSLLRDGYIIEVSIKLQSKKTIMLKILNNNITYYMEFLDVIDFSLWGDDDFSSEDGYLISHLKMIKNDLDIFYISFDPYTEIAYIEENDNLIIRCENWILKW